MIGRRGLMGLSLLSALVFCAFAAPSAFAATEGTTVVTCVSGATNDYSDAHCDTHSGSGFGHRAITANPTEVEGTNAATKNSTTESTNGVLDSVVGGIHTEISCTTVSSAGTVENKLAGEVHSFAGSGIVITYTGCTVTLPATCKVHSPGQAVGTIATNSLKSESLAAMGVKFSPTTGEEFVKLVIENNGGTCASAAEPAVKGTVTASESGTNSPNSAGSTLIVNLPRNASSTLTVGGQKAGLVLATTGKMKGGSPLAATNAPYTVN